MYDAEAATKGCSMALALPVVDYLDLERDRPRFLRDELRHALSDVGFLVLKNYPEARHSSACSKRHAVSLMHLWR